MSALLLVALAGCGPAKQVQMALEGPPDRTEWEQERIDRAIEQGAVLIGMTKSEVRRSRGEPLRSDHVRRFGGIKVNRWAYAWDEVYFDDRGLVIGTYAAYR